MDSITHISAGLLLPIAYPKAPKRSSLLFFGALTANLPDIDTIFSHGTPEGLMLIHRALTHSVFLQVFLMLALVFPFFIYMSCRIKSQKKPPDFTEQLNITSPELYQPSLLMLCAIALFNQYIHVYLDCVTTFGTQAFLPLSSLRIALPAMFIVDPFILIPSATLLIIALKSGSRVIIKKDSSRYLGFSKKAAFLARCALCWILIYPMINLCINAALSRQAAGKEQMDSSHIFLLTEPFSPFIWKKVIENKDSYTVSTLLSLSPNAERKEKNFTKPKKEFLDSLSAQIPLFRTYTDFATLMVQENRNLKYEELCAFPDIGVDTEIIYTFKDIRYIAVHGSLTKFFDIKITPFVFEIAVDSKGQVRAYRFMDNSSRLSTPWIKIITQLASKDFARYNLAYNLNFKIESLISHD